MSNGYGLYLCTPQSLCCTYKAPLVSSTCFTVQASVAAAMATGVANRVLYKMALVPMGNYVFVLSQFQTFGYLLVYFGILAARYK